MKLQLNSLEEIQEVFEKHKILTKAGIQDMNDLREKVKDPKDDNVFEVIVPAVDTLPVAPLPSCVQLPAI